MFRLSILLLSFFLFCGFSHGRGPETFYVSNAGNDSNDGQTTATAWATPGKVNSSSFNSGDTVAFDGGSTFSAGLSLTQANAPSNLKLTSFNAGQPTFNTGNSASCVVLSYLPATTVNNFNCVGGGNFTNTTVGILSINPGTYNIAGPTITNNSVSQYGHSCIAVAGGRTSAPYGGFDWVTVSGNTTHDCTGNFNPGVGPGDINCCGDCIQVGAGNVGFRAGITGAVISNNTASNCTGTPAVGGQTSWTGGGILCVFCTNSTITHNLVHDIDQDNTFTSSGPVGIQYWGGATGVISFNEVYNTVGPGGDGECFDISDNLGAVLEYNYAHHCQTGTVLMGSYNSPSSNLVARFNIFEDTNTNILMSCGGAGGCSNPSIYNNTFTTGIEGGFGGTATGTTAVNVSNNIFYASGGGISFGNSGSSATWSVTATGNDYYDLTGSGNFSATINATTYTSLASFQTAGFEKVAGNPVGTTANPNLTNPGSGGNCGGWNGTCPTAYDLTAASPAGKGNGLNLNSLYGFNVATQDFYGNAVTNTTLPIGAAANK